MGKTRTKEELKIIKSALEYELIDIVGANVDEYSIDILSDIEDEKEMKKVEKRCEKLHEKDLKCLFEILVTNYLEYLINKYDLVVENDEVDFELVTPIYTEYMTKYLGNKL